MCTPILLDTLLLGIDGLPGLFKCRQCKQLRLEKAAYDIWKIGNLKGLHNIKCTV